jgi:aldehyde:ferredoxin oxidoreductase
MFGWMGTILRVDLTSGKIVKQPLSEALGCNYAGGRGINLR